MGPSYQYAAKMIRVIDGDTYEVAVDLGFRVYHNIHVRLKNFDTAELRSSNTAEVEHAKAARDFVADLLPRDTKIVLLSAKGAAYSRWEADVYFHDDYTWVSLAKQLDVAGFAKRETYE